MNRTAILCTSIATLGLLATAAVLTAGPLNPPAGPVAGTYKTLSEVEPRIAINATNTPGDATSLFMITQPGSYYLTGNVTGVAGKHGIAIAASGVTLDLNGFDLVGVSGMGAVDGVRTTVAGLNGISVLNGSVRNWGQDGINMGSVVATGCRVEGVRLAGNTRLGVYGGFTAAISQCTASGGQYGISARTGSTVLGCSATATSAIGIQVDGGGVVTRCSAYSNTGIGISANGGSTVSDCSAYLNSGTGILVSFGSTASNCSVHLNTGLGIFANIGSTVADCAVNQSTSDGIQCGGTCIVRGNCCTANGNFGDGAGIHATGTDNRIEGNTCTIADRGIDVDAAGNFIIGNTCSGNTTNWDVVAGNTILVVQGTSAGAVLGNTGGLAPGSTDPNANFSY